MATNENNENIVNAAEQTAVPAVEQRQAKALSAIEVEDRGGFVWGIVGFLAPILGLILHLIMRKSLPKNASALKKGVIAGIIVIAVLIVLYIVLIASLASTASMGF